MTSQALSRGRALPDTGWVSQVPPAQQPNARPDCEQKEDVAPDGITLLLEDLSPACRLQHHLRLEKLKGNQESPGLPVSGTKAHSWPLTDFLANHLSTHSTIPTPGT